MARSRRAYGLPTLNRLLNGIDKPNTKPPILWALMKAFVLIGATMFCWQLNSPMSLI
jgi:hypothetical protein